MLNWLVNINYSGDVEEEKAVQFTERQQEIVDAAVDIIARQGIQELTIKKLSQRIGISEPALYRHFENKHAILVAILEFFGEWSRCAVADIAESPMSPEEKLRQVFRRHTKRFIESPATSGVVFAEEIFKNEPALAESTVRIMGVAQATVHGILEEGIAAGTFRADVPVEHLAAAVLGSLRLLVIRWRLSDYQFDLYEQGEELATSLVSMVSG